MALVVADRVKETTTSTGTGTIDLAGAVAGFQTFVAGVGDTNTTYYAIIDPAGGTWEVGIGTVTDATPDTLSRDTIIASSNSGSAVNFGAGNKNVFSTQPADKAVYLDSSGQLVIGGVAVTSTAAELNYVDGVTSNIQTQLDSKLNLSGGTMTGVLTLSGAPTADNHATTKIYVDELIAAGIHYHDPVRVESPDSAGSLTATYNNGASGVGATLTNNGTQAALVIDGVTLNTNDRVLIYNQTNAFENGIYTVTNTGSASTNWVLTRATDADSYGVDNQSLSEGTSIFVLEGTDGSGEVYACTTTGTITFGTTAINFSQIGKSAVITGNGGITVTGNQVSANVDATVQTTTANSVTSTASRTYALQVDSGNDLVVNVPWTDTTTNQTITLSGDASGSGTTSISVSLATDSVGSDEIAANAVSASELNVTGNGTTSQFLRSDGDGSFTWATPTDTNTTYSAGSGLSLTGTTFANTAPDQTVSLTGSGATTVSGTYPNFTISSTDTDTNTTYSTATASTLGLVKIGYTENGKNYPVELSSGQMFVNVPWTDTDTNTTYSAGNGLSLSGTTFSSVYLPAVDDRDMKPNTSGISSSVKGIKAFFSSYQGMTSTANTDYQDVLVLDTYSDTTGGNVNAITMDKSDGQMRLWNAAQTATTWGTPSLVWTSTNDGSGSGLDADTVDGQHASAFALSSHVHSYLPLSGGTITGDITASNNAKFVGDATNALALGGLPVHGGRNDDPNKIVRTQANGYIDCGWINTTSGDRGGAVPNRIYASNDAYIRYYDLASFRSFMNVTAKTGYQGREQNTSDTNYWTGTMGWGNTTFANLFKYGSGSIESSGGPSDAPSTETTHWVGSQHLHYTNSTSDYGHQIVVGAGNPAYMYVRGRWGTTDYGWAKMWNSSNDGSGSGLDADTVDGLHESTFMRRSANSQLDMNNNAIVGVDQLVHEGDVNTYIQFHAADQFRVVTGGVERLEVNNSQIIVANDMLINGTLSVRTAIDLADNDILRFGGSDDCEMFCNGAHMLIDLNSGIGDLIIRDGTTTRFILADDGNFTATGDVTAFSDIRLKENVETIDNALDKVKSMRGVTYTKDGKNGLGVIAQEVEEVIPQVVLTADDEIGTKSVAYGNMVGLLIEAVKEQQEQIDALKNEITALKGLD